jgi:hypothetical protein
MPELVDALPAHLRDSYSSDFCLADVAFYAGRLESTSRGRKIFWDHWQEYTKPVGVDPYLQDTPFSKRVRLLSGFTARVRMGYYGNGNQVKNCTVSSAITAVGQTIVLACDSNPTKVIRLEQLLPRLQIMLEGYRKADPPTRKKLPVKLDIPELLVEQAYQTATTQRQRATADLTMVVFYYLLWVGKYMVKGSRNSTKQMVQFKYEDVSFFQKNIHGQLRCLPRDAPDHLIATAVGATLKLDNQNNEWKGVCVYHEANSNKWHCLVRALKHCYLHLCMMGTNAKIFLSAYFDDDTTRRDITNKDISRALKVAATLLDYPTAKGIPVDCIDTHLL